MEGTDLKSQVNGQGVPKSQSSCCEEKTTTARRLPWIIAAVLLITVLAVYMGWDWLAATGIASLLLSLLPCLAMCALGLCMRGKKHTAE